MSIRSLISAGALCCAALALCPALVTPANAQTTLFTTPGQFDFVVPSGVTSALVVVNGAGGGAGSGNGGNGGSLTATLANLVAGQTLTLFVGSTTAGGIGANGSAGVRGGEFSAIAFGAGVTRDSLIAAGTANGVTNTALLVLAGGGGGGGSFVGGAGGGATGGNGGGGATGGSGGSQTAGGSAGSGSGQIAPPNSPFPSEFFATGGSFLQGGTVRSGPGGGGGGGFFGGGGGAVEGFQGGGGGGGSSYSSANPSAFNGSVMIVGLSQTQGGGGKGETFFTAAERGSISITTSTAVTAAPEPGTMALVAMGLMGTAGMVIRRCHKA